MSNRNGPLIEWRNLRVHRPRGPLEAFLVIAFFAMVVLIAGRWW